MTTRIPPDFSRVKESNDSPCLMILPGYWLWFDCISMAAFQLRDVPGKGSGYLLNPSIRVGMNQTSPLRSNLKKQVLENHRIKSFRRETSRVPIGFLKKLLW